MNNIKVLFICMGNICRSPTAEGAFKELVEREGLAHIIEIDSAGTHASHSGEVPDHRAQKVAWSRGVDLAPLRARRVEEADFAKFDYIVAMDRSNLRRLHDKCPEQYRNKLSLMMSYAPHVEEEEVPDPYYGGPSGFERVFDLVEAASEGLLREIRQRLE